MKQKLNLVGVWVFISILCYGAPVNGQQKAFPDAQGWASATPGGRGGKIIRVTNLNDSGPGSLLEAIDTKGPRIIVFEVAGVIDLKGATLRIREPFVTIAGQTAPSPGITLIDGSINVHGHDVVIQHLRLRLGASRHEKGWEPDGLTTAAAYNVIIDHCTFTWAIDENCSASGPRFNGANPDEWRMNTSHRVTISNNIIAEALSNSTHSKGEHSKGTLIHDNATDILIIGNLYASNKDRNALFKGGARGLYVNNYIHNPGANAVRYALVASEWEGRAYEKGQLSIVGNVMQLGPSSMDMPFAYIGNGPCETFMADNVAVRKDGTPGKLRFGDDSKFVGKAPVWFDGLKPLPASKVKEQVSENAGARPWDRDEHDKRIIREMFSGVGKIIDSEMEVGGYPTFKPVFRRFSEKEWDLSTMTSRKRLSR